MKAVSGKDLCKVLEREGWKLKRVRGSHHIYQKEGFSPLPVPVHGNKTLGTGLQKDLMKQAGLTEEDL